MSTSTNGWDVIPTGTDSRLVAIPKVAGRVRKGDVEFIFKRLIALFDSLVEDVDLGEDDWGYANRPVRGGTTPSDHASGTAIDLNATQHPIGRAGTFSTKELAAIHKIVKDLKGAVEWGGVWDRPDEMHFSINVSEAKLASIVKSLKAADAAKVAPKADPVIEERQRRLRTAGYYTGPVNGLKSTAYTNAIKKYQKGQKAPYKLLADGIWGATTEAHYKWVKALQTKINAFGSTSGSKLYVDGDYGQVTILKVKSLQTKYRGSRYKGKVDGIPGSVFCKMLGIAVHP